MCMVTRRLCTLLDLHTSKNQEQSKKKKKGIRSILLQGQVKDPSLMCMSMRHRQLLYAGTLIFCRTEKLASIYLQA